MNKKIISFLLTFIMLFNTVVTALAADTPDKIKEPEVIEPLIIPTKLEENMKTAISKVYGTENTDTIYTHVLKIIEKAQKERGANLINDDRNRPSDWYKDEVIYMFYADQFGVNEKGEPATFKNNIKMLPYLKNLGVTTIYILPFADSPMGDSGFDVRDPRNVRSDLGGLTEFKEFLTEARKQGFKIKADLVLNHLSDQHQWFQDALKGDLSKINYFVVREEMPEFKKYTDDKLGMVVEYKEPDGKISKRRLIFPEITDNHYRKVTINNKDYYFYHTFYPFQLDINWKNPEVLYYSLENIAYWANLGIDIFRMDAIPYLIKENGTNAENLEETHEIIKLLSSFLQVVAPRSVIQAEACQSPKKILPYFGEEKKINHLIKDEVKEINRTDEVQIAYHFPYMPAIWASLVSGDSKYFWKAHKQTPKIPESASWAIFLRVHDELTLEMVNKETRKLIYEDLEPKGAEFRKGFGVSGRMANFLDNNPDRIGMAFSILLSLPGVPIIYYGDEIGIQNNFRNARRLAWLKERHEKLKEKQTKGQNKVEVLSYFDSRDINRGAVPEQTYYDALKNDNSFDNQVYRRVRQLIRIRKANPIMARGDFEQVKTNRPEIFAYTRKLGDEQILVINNLSDKRVTAKVNIPVTNWWKKDNKVYLVDLLRNRKRLVQISVLNKQMMVRMKPYDSAWIKIQNLEPSKK